MSCPTGTPQVAHLPSHTASLAATPQTDHQPRYERDIRKSTIPTFTEES